jgi:hypothetical protein
MKQQQRLAHIWLVLALAGGVCGIGLGQAPTAGAATAADPAPVTFTVNSAVVPAHAREALIEITLTRVFGSYDDGYVDNVSLMLLPKVALFLPLVIN